MTDPAAPDRLWSCGCGWSFFTDDPVQGAAEKVEHHTSGEHLDNQLEIQRRSQAAAPVGLDLDRIRELLAKATPGPWRVVNEHPEWQADRIEGPYRFVSGKRKGEIAPKSGTFVCEGLEPADGTSDAALIVALRNQAGALLDLASRMQGVIEAASAVEQSYECCDEVTMRGTVPNYLMGNLMSELIRLRSLLPREPK